MATNLVSSIISSWWWRSSIWRGMCSPIFISFVARGWWSIRYIRRVLIWIHVGWSDLTMNFNFLFFFFFFVQILHVLKKKEQKRKANSDLITLSFSMDFLSASISGEFSYNSRIWVAMSGFIKNEENKLSALACFRVLQNTYHAIALTLLSVLSTTFCLLQGWTFYILLPNKYKKVQSHLGDIEGKRLSAN